jgi:nucleoside-diphosphate-sugar epimerase
VCEALRRSAVAARLVQIGCGSEYGPSPAGASTGEDAMPRPGGPYGVSKLAGTEIVLGSGLDAVVLRVFSPVGPGTPTGAPLGRIAEALRRAMQNGEPELKLGGLTAQRDFVDVRDVARAVHAASLSAAQGVVNIGSGRAIRLRDMAAALAHVAGYEGVLHELDEPPGGVPGAHPPYPDGCGLWQQADIRTARDRLGWRPRIALEESLADVWMEAACRV